MLVRAILAAIVSMALAFAGAGHAAPVGKGHASMGAPEAAAPEAAASHAMASATHHEVHAGHHDMGKAAEPAHEQPAKSTNGCLTADNCVGCSAHCPAMALLAAPSVPTRCRPAVNFCQPEGPVDLGLTRDTERPPEVI